MADYLLFKFVFEFLALGTASFYGYKCWKKYCERQQYAKFSHTPKDTVIVHGFPMVSIPLPTCVPWDIKIRTFCFMNNIKHVTDDKYPWGPKEKTPWISLNGVHLGDSQLIVEYLSKKYDINMNAGYTEEELAVSRAVRIMLEERWYWALPLWRWIRDDGHAQWYKDFARMRHIFPLPLAFLRKYFQIIIGNETRGHGIGRHSPEERLELFKGDLRTTSLILGNKKFILGEKLKLKVPSLTSTGFKRDFFDLSGLPTVDVPFMHTYNYSSARRSEFADFSLLCGRADFLSGIEEGKLVQLYYNYSTTPRATRRQRDGLEIRTGPRAVKDTHRANFKPRWWAHYCKCVASSLK